MSFKVKNTRKSLVCSRVEGDGIKYSFVSIGRESISEGKFKCFEFIEILPSHFTVIKSLGALGDSIIQSSLSIDLDAILIAGTEFND